MGDTVHPSVVKGMDIEYTDAFDNRKKYCQLKAGPTTINYDDVDTICNHFKSLMKLGVTNHLKISNEDCVTGVLYGDNEDLSTMYTNIRNQGYVVLAGEEFWKHLTGLEGIYKDLVLTARKASNDSSMKNSINRLIDNVEDYVSKNKDLFGLKS